MYRSGFIVLFSIQYADVFLELFCPLVTTHTHNKHLNEAVELDLFPLLLDLFMPRVFGDANTQYHIHVTARHFPTEVNQKQLCNFNRLEINSEVFDRMMMFTWIFIINLNSCCNQHRKPCTDVCELSWIIIIIQHMAECDLKQKKSMFWVMHMESFVDMHV